MYDLGGQGYDDDMDAGIVPAPAYCICQYLIKNCTILVKGGSKLTPPVMYADENVPLKPWPVTPRLAHHPTATLGSTIPVSRVNNCNDFNRIIENDNLPDGIHPSLRPS